MKRLSFKIALLPPLDSYRFLFVWFFSALWCTYKNRKKIRNIIRYKQAINHSQNTIAFLFNCFLSESYAKIFPYFLAKNTKKYLAYFSVEGKEHINNLVNKDTGVILISGHYGPRFHTFWFKEVFGIKVSSFGSALFEKRFRKFCAQQFETYHPFTCYKPGEEKHFQDGLRKKEWIIFLNDVPMKIKRPSNNQTLFGKRIYLSELPFKISLQHNIPILFVGITRSKRQYFISILPLNEFHSPAEGLKKYIELVERLLSRDPYANLGIPKKHF